MVGARKKISSSSSSCLPNTNHRHFFKVYLPAFSSQRLKIPETFMKNFKGVVPQKTILKGSLGRFWHVELVNVGGDFFFQDGWLSFVKDHALQLGEILVFGYEGNSMFDVKIFDNSGCEKEGILADRKVHQTPWIKEEEQTESEETFTECIDGSKRNSGDSEKGIVECRCLADEDEYTQSKIAEVNVIEEESPMTTGSVSCHNIP